MSAHAVQDPIPSHYLRFDAVQRNFRFDYKIHAVCFSSLLLEKFEALLGKKVIQSNRIDHICALY